MGLIARIKHIHTVYQICRLENQTVSVSKALANTAKTILAGKFKSGIDVPTKNISAPSCKADIPGSKTLPERVVVSTNPDDHENPVGLCITKNYNVDLVQEMFRCKNLKSILNADIDEAVNIFKLAIDGLFSADDVLTALELEKDGSLQESKEFYTSLKSVMSKRALGSNSLLSQKRRKDSLPNLTRN